MQRRRAGEGDGKEGARSAGRRRRAAEERAGEGIRQGGCSAGGGEVEGARAGRRLDSREKEVAAVCGCWMKLRRFTRALEFRSRGP